MPFKSFKELDATSKDNQHVIFKSDNPNLDLTYRFDFSSPNGTYATDSQSAKERVDEILDEFIYDLPEDKDVNPITVGNKIFHSIEKIGGVQIFKDFEKECVDVNNMKLAFIDALTGKGDPSQAHKSFLDKKALENGEHKLDHKKIGKFIDKLNNNLDKQSKIFANPNSVYNKAVRLSKYSRYAANDFMDVIERAMDNVGINLDNIVQDKELGAFASHDLLTKGIKEGTIRNFTPEEYENILVYYNELKGRTDNYFQEMKDKNPGVYERDIAVLKEAKIFLKNTFSLTDKDLNHEIDVKKEVKEYESNLQTGQLSLRQNLKSLSDCANKYNEHGFLWKMFLGRSARNEMKFFSNKLKELGVTDKYIDAIKNGDMRKKSFYEDEYNKITNKLENTKTLTGKEIKDQYAELNTLKYFCTDKELSYAINDAYSIYDNAIKNSSASNLITQDFMEDKVSTIIPDMDFNSLELVKGMANQNDGNEKEIINDPSFYEGLKEHSNVEKQESQKTAQVQNTKNRSEIQLEDNENNSINMN